MVQARLWESRKNIACEKIDSISNGECLPCASSAASARGLGSLVVLCVYLFVSFTVRICCTTVVIVCDFGSLRPRGKRRASGQYLNALRIIGFA